MLAEVEQEIAKLQSVANALRSIESSQSKSGTTTKRKGHQWTDAERKAMSLKQKARWAKQKSGQPTKGKRVISAASRRKMAAAQKARWAKIKGKA